MKRVRVYHLLSAKHGLDDLKQGRLKVAEFRDLNDPFELLSVELSDRTARRRFAAWRESALGEYGVLCFSTSWKSPVLWSHYADRHKGLCLGFDLPESLLSPVTYLKSRSSFGDLLPPASSTGSQPEALFYTKFQHWQYEDEVRRVVRLDEAVRLRGLYFWPFGPDLKLMEVVPVPVAVSRGASCSTRLASMIAESLLPKRVSPSQVSRSLRSNAASRALDVTEHLTPADRSPVRLAPWPLTVAAWSSDVDAARSDAGKRYAWPL